MSKDGIRGLSPNLQVRSDPARGTPPNDNAVRSPAGVPVGRPGASVVVEQADGIARPIKPSLVSGGEIRSPAAGLVTPAAMKPIAPRQVARRPAVAGQDDADCAAYNREVEAYREQVMHAVQRGQAVRGAPGSQVAFWASALLSTPSQFLLVNTRLVESLGDAGLRRAARLRAQGGLAAVAGYALAPFAALVKLVGLGASGVARLVDLPFAGLRAFSADAAHERVVAENRASHRRVGAEDWPALPQNAATEAQVRVYLAGAERRPFDVIIVPGTTGDEEQGRLSDKGKARLAVAAQDFHAGLAPFIMVSGGNVHPAGTRYNEAFEMQRFLTAELGVPAERILIEPLAMHSTTNLRNAGRMMRRLGLSRAVVTTSPQPFEQSYYLQTADSPFYGFHMRSVAETGARFGSLRRVDAHHTEFVPDRSVELSPIGAGGDDP